MDTGRRHDVRLLNQAVDGITIHVNGLDDRAVFKPGTGTTMGHSIAAGDFVDVYAPNVDKWNKALKLAD
eukprot:9472371-Pyramimonas_sp.AAC.1